MKESQKFKVSTKTNINSLAGAIAGTIKNNRNGNIELQAIGAGAVNQVVKAIAVARGFLAPEGIDLVWIPAFTEVYVENETRSGIKFILKEEK